MSAPEKVFEWAEPPPASASGARGRLLGAPERLRESPGKWALLGQHPASTGTQIRQGKRGFGPAGAFEAATRTAAETKVHDLYVRFVGESGEFQ